MDFNQLFNTVAFPVFCTVGMAIFVRQVLITQNTQNENREERLFSKISNSDKICAVLVETNESLVATNEMISSNLVGKINNIDSKIDTLIDQKRG